MSLEVADARHLPLEDESIELLITSPPWDKPSIVKKCRKEWSRVLKPDGRIALIWRYEIEVFDRDWKIMGTTHAPPQGEMGVDYRVTPEWAVEILLKDDPAEVVCDPMMGVGTIPLVADKLGKTAYGFDINPEAVERAELRTLTLST